MWSGLGSVGVRFSYSLVQLGFVPVRDGLCLFRICCSSTWQKAFLAVSCRGDQFAWQSVGGGQLSCTALMLLRFCVRIATYLCLYGN